MIASQPRSASSIVLMIRQLIWFSAIAERNRPELRSAAADRRRSPSVLRTAAAAPASGPCRPRGSPPNAMLLPLIVPRPRAARRYRSSAWVGCSFQPSPALMTGDSDWRHAAWLRHPRDGEHMACTGGRSADLQAFPGSHIRAGRRHVLHPDRMAAEGDRGDLETDPCPGARLKEQKSNRISDKSQRRRNADLVASPNGRSRRRRRC